MSQTLASIVQALGGQLFGYPHLLITHLASFENAGPESIAFVSHPGYLDRISNNQAGCLIISQANQSIARERGACIVVDDPYVYFARLTQWWKKKHLPHFSPVIDALASIHPSARLEAGVSIGPFSVVGENAHIASGARIDAHVVIGSNSFIGTDTRIYAHVSVRDHCVIGARCILHSGAVIGSDGFGFAAHTDGWIKIEHLGGVRIGNDVEIGANTCVDRGSLDDTIIEDGVKLDNLIQIGHNVRIGAHTAIAGCVGIAGSAHIGAHCTLGGGSVVLGHLSLANHVHISAASVVTRSLNKPGHYTGIFPIDENTKWEKNAASLKRLYSLREQLKSLERLIEDNINHTRTI